VYCLNRRVARLTGTNTDHLVDRPNEDFSITDATRPGSRHNGLNGALAQIIGYDGFNLDLGQKIHHVLSTTIDLGVALLPAKSFDIGNGKAVDPHVGKRLSHLVKLKGFHNGSNQFHSIHLT